MGLKDGLLQPNLYKEGWASNAARDGTIILTQVY